MDTDTGTPRSDPAATAAFRAARDFLLDHREDYPTAYREFRWPRLERFNWALDWFDVIAAEHPERDALWIVEDGGRDLRLSYAALSARSDRVAGWLRERGVRRGDRVLLMLGNEVALWEVILAAMKLGAVIIPATTLLSRDDVADRIERGRIAHVVAAAASAPAFAGVPGGWTRIAVGGSVSGWQDYPADPHPGDGAGAAGGGPEATGFVPDAPTGADDLLLLYFTSGTTARPKLVAHTHASYPVGHLSTMYWLGLLPGDVHLNISSPGWAKHAWSNVFAPWNAGATALVVNQARFAAAPLLDQIVRCGVTTFCAPPTVWRMLVQQDLTAWARPGAGGSGARAPMRECVAAGEPLNPEVIDQVRRAWGVTVRDGYGQTETTAQIGNPPGQPVRLGSMGRPLPGYTVALVDPVSGAPVPEGSGADGEICLDLSTRPLGLMTGYLGDADLDARAMAGGYYHTGDVASADADGYITYVGRTDDVFKASDYRISPFELESVLIEHPAVAEAAVVPSPDPVRLAVPKAYVVLAAGHRADAATARDILAYCRERLAPFKRIRRLEFAELPKTVSGKIRRVQLRDREQRVNAPPGAGQTAAGRAAQGRPGSAGDSSGAAGVPAERGTRGDREFWEEDFPDLKK